MGVWYDNFRNGNVELVTAWDTQAGGFHIYRWPSEKAGGKWINWLRGDNVASIDGAKRISHALPNEADLSKSIEWRFIFKQNNTGANDRIRFWMFSNVSSLLYTDASLNGYMTLIAPSGLFRIYRVTGGAANFIMDGDASYSGDTNEHEVVITREVSAANRYWRMYIDGVLASGPFNDATHTTGSYYGWNCDERDQIGEIKITS